MDQVKNRSDVCYRLKVVKLMYLDNAERTIEKLLCDKLNAHCECKVAWNQVVVFVFRMGKTEKKASELRDKVEEYLTGLIEDRRKIMVISVDRVYQTEDSFKQAEMDVQMNLEGADTHLVPILEHFKTWIKPGLPVDLYLDKGQFVLEVDRDYALDKDVDKLREDINNVLIVNNWCVSTRYKGKEN